MAKSMETKLGRFMETPLLPQHPFVLFPPVYLRIKLLSKAVWPMASSPMLYMSYGHSKEGKGHIFNGDDGNTQQSAISAHNAIATSTSRTKRCKKHCISSRLAKLIPSSRSGVSVELLPLLRAKLHVCS